MFVIEVIPLQRGIRIDALSYFGSVAYPPGTLLTVPIRNRMVRAMVTSTEEVSVAKTALRAATFSLKKLPPQERVEQLSPALIKTAESLSASYAISVGLVLYSLLPSNIQNGETALPHTHHLNGSEKHLPEILQANRIERYLAYRSLVRETFAHSGSLLMVVPSSIEAQELFDTLSSGIEDRIIVLTSTMPKKALNEAYTKLDDFSKPQLIIATPAHSIIERHDITHVVMEHARSPYYKGHTRPYLDYRDALRVHAYETGRRFIMGDLLMRSEEELARREERFVTFGETPKRIELQGKLEVVNMQTKTHEAPSFELFSPKVIEAIRDVRKTKGRIFIFAARRGLAPVVGCSDCGYIFRSPQSGAPYSLIRTMRAGVEERWFVCSTSGQRERAADVCPICGSWRLRERGIGIQHVHDELHKLLKGIPIILFDHTTASTYKKACFLRDTFYSTKGSVMLGTHMAIPYLTKSINASVVVNMDALLATPTWRLEEDNLALLLALRETTKGNVYVQTRTKDNSLILHAKHASVEHFYDEELELRKTFNYPPFTIFVHLTWQGESSAVKKIEKEVQKILSDFSPSIYPSPTPPRNTIILYCLIRISTKDWPKKSLTDALRRLPPSVRVVLNPDRII